MVLTLSSKENNMNPSALATLICIALAPADPAASEIVEHHGSIVNVNGTYAECLPCHDGIIAQQISPCFSHICFFRGDHPVNKLYPPSQKLLNFHPAAMAEQAGIIFIDSKIDCVSCHNLKNTVRFHLRIDSRNDKLCRACHIK